MTLLCYAVPSLGTLGVLDGRLDCC